MSLAKIASILLVLFSVSLSLGQSDIEEAPSGITSFTVEEESIATEDINAPDIYAPTKPRMYANPFALSQFFFLLLIGLPPALVCNFLAGQKGKDRVVWTILGIIPFVNLYAMIYLVGSRDEVLASKLDDVLKLLIKEEEKD